jgi:putative membrane protein
VLSKILRLVLLVIVLIAGIAWHSRNGQLVSLNFYAGNLDVPVSLVVVASLLVGAVLGVLASTAIIVRLQRQNRQLTRRMQAAEQQQKMVNAVAVKDAF